MGGPDPLADLLAQLTLEQSTAARMGNAYLAVADQCRLATTEAGLRGSCGEGVAGLRQAIAALVRADLARGDTVLVEGWVLARAEAEDAGADLLESDPVMLTDLNSLESGQELQADLVIVGAGAAGISLALEFLHSHHQVLLVESGNLDADADTQSLDEGSVIGLTYPPLEAARARYFGGTTNMWTGWCKPLDPIDLRPRPWLGIAGWPIAREELQPFYVRAQQVVEAGPYRYDLAQWVEAVGEVDDMSVARLEQTFWQKSPPTNFGRRYLEPLRQGDEHHRPAERKPDRDPDDRPGRASSKVSSCVQ